MRTPDLKQALLALRDLLEAVDQKDPTGLLSARHQAGLVLKKHGLSSFYRVSGDRGPRTPRR